MFGDSDEESKRVNPYQPPEPIDPGARTWSQWFAEVIRRADQVPRNRWEDASLLEFIQGRSIVFDGIVFFILPDEGQVLHAAIPLRENTPELIARCRKEVVRVLPEFLRAFPDLDKVIAPRELQIRFISEYANLESEVAPRVMR